MALPQISSFENTFNYVFRLSNCISLLKSVKFGINDLKFRFRRNIRFWRLFHLIENLRSASIDFQSTFNLSGVKSRFYSAPLESVFFPVWKLDANIPKSTWKSVEICPEPLVYLLSGVENNTWNQVYYSIEKIVLLFTSFQP